MTPRGRTRRAAGTNNLAIVLVAIWRRLRLRVGSGLLQAEMHSPGIQGLTAGPRIQFAQYPGTCFGQGSGADDAKSITAIADPHAKAILDLP